LVWIVEGEVMKIPQTGRYCEIVLGVHALGAYLAGSTTLVNVAVPGANVGDAVIYNSEMAVGDVLAGLGMKIQPPWVSAAGVVSFIAANDGLVAQPAAARNYSLMVLPARS
jgi:hypothetical protein